MERKIYEESNITKDDSLLLIDNIKVTNNLISTQFLQNL